MKILKNLFIIPARKNSKRFPGKNYADLNGMPLIMHSICYAHEDIGPEDKIVVTTDDPKIKDIALEAGVSVVDRPAHLSTDTATTVSALKHVLEVLADDFENVILLQPTNPLRPQDLLSEAFKEYKNREVESLLTVTRSYHKLGRIEDKSFVPLSYQMGQRSQDLQPLYFENGLLYIAKADLILENKLISSKNCAYVVDHPYAEVDIDRREDLEFARYLLTKKTKS